MTPRWLLFFLNVMNDQPFQPLLLTAPTHVIPEQKVLKDTPEMYVHTFQDSRSFFEQHKKRTPGTAPLLVKDEKK